MSRKKNSDSPTVVNMLRPRDAKVDAQIGQEYLDGKQPNLNRGLMSKDDYRKLCDQRHEVRESIKAAKKSGAQLPSPFFMPNIYSPVVAQLAVERGAKVAYGGQQASKSGKSKPADWNDHLLGEWLPGMKLGTYRLMHTEDVRKLVAPEALVKVGNSEYVVATTGKDGEAAAFLINGSRTGNYAANHAIGKKLSYAKLTTEDGKQVTKTEFSTVVGQINNSLVTETWENGHEITFFPNQTVTWGHLVKSGKVLTPTQIRELKDAKGVSFRPLSNRWVGQFVSRDPFVKDVKALMSLASTKDEEGLTDWDRFGGRPRRSTDKAKQNQEKEADAWNNISKTQSRDLPERPFCFGLRYAAIGQSIGVHWEVVNGKPACTIFVCLGGHLTCGLSQLNQKWDVNREISGQAKPTAKSDKKSDKAGKAKKDESKKSESKKSSKKSTKKSSKKSSKKSTKKSKKSTTKKSDSKKTSDKKDADKATKPVASAETSAPPIESSDSDIIDPDLRDDFDDDYDQDEEELAEAELSAEQRDRAEEDALASLQD